MAMNQNVSSLSNTSLSSGTDTVSTLTTAHLILIALIALIVIAGIVYGARVSARRKAAERMVREHIEEAGAVTASPGRAAPPATGGSTPAPTPAATDDGGAAGPVSQLKGLGPKVAARLGELGIANVGQIAALDHDAAQALDAQMGPFQGRLERDRWIEQARFLAAGDVKGFEAVFGRL